MGHPWSMSSTTIKVTRETRDLLKEQAASQRKTLDEYLRSLAEQQARRERMRQWADAVRQTSSADMESYHRENQAWDQVNGDGLKDVNDRWS